MESGINADKCSRATADERESVRTNIEMEILVNRGLAVAHMVSVQAGSDVMLKDRVPEHVIKRVLDHPEQRRESDWRC